MSKPTKAARNAANYLAKTYGGGDIAEDAEIIDRETGLPELLRLLGEAVEAKSARMAMPDGWLTDARNALRKAGEM